MNNQTDTEILNASREQNAYWRRLFNKMDVEFTERVVRVDNVCEFSGKVRFTDIYIEVETEHATGCVVRFQSGESLSAAVLKNDAKDAHLGKKGFLGGTWRKHRHIVGHACPWYRTQKLGNRAASPGSKFTELCCDGVTQNIMMLGRRWTGEVTQYKKGHGYGSDDPQQEVVVPKHPADERLHDARRILGDEMKLERAREELAKAEAKAALAGAAA